MQYALVPVKDVTQAKARLSPLLSPDERRDLAIAMLDDVLGALQRSRRLECIAVVTSDPHALSVADERGFVAIDEGTLRGLTEAVELGVQACLERGASSLVVIPGDLPLLQPGDVDRVCEHGADYDVVIVPSWNSRGTNMVLLRPPDVLRLRFGNWSFFPHLRRAKKASLAYKVLRLPRVALDVDTPEDLAKVVGQAAGTRTYQELERMGVLARFRVR